MYGKSKPSLNPNASIIEQRKTIGESIIIISSAVSELRTESRLNAKAIVILLAYKTKLPAKLIAQILDALATLKDEFTQ